MKTFTKYLIEFFVIIFGVSISFFAEQWRQEHNEKKENEELFAKAKLECEDFFSDSDREKNYCNFLKRLLNNQAFDEDSIQMILSYGIDENINSFFPSVLELGKRKQLTPKQNEFFQQISSWISVLPKINQEYKDGIKRLEPHLIKYGIDDDLTIEMESYLAKIEKSKTLEPFDVKKNKVKYKGRYKSFVDDPEVHILLKNLYANLLNAQLWFFVSKKEFAELERN
jgi:hypothetical protein